MNENIRMIDPGEPGDIMISWEDRVIWINHEEFQKIEKACYDLRVKMIREYLHKRDGKDANS